MSKFDKKYYENDVALGKRESENFIKEYIMKLPKKSRLLDVGCGTFIMLKKIHKWRPDLKLYGIDIGDVGKPPRCVTYKKSSGDKMKFASNMFDMVICLHVLEHTNNPHDFVSEFVRVTRPRGHIYVETPYYKKTMLCDCKMNFWSDPTHIRPHSKISMIRLLKENNLKSVRVRVFRNWFSLLISPYLLLKYIFKGDQEALGCIQAHMGGNAIGGIGVK